MPLNWELQWQGFCDHSQFFFRTKAENDGVNFNSKTEKVCVRCDSTLIFAREDFLL